MKIRFIFLSISSVMLSFNCLASGTAVGRIYNPYVQQLEKEIEYELLIQNDEETELGNRQTHKLSYGHSLSDHWLAEVAIIGSASEQQSLAVSAYELEAKWQLTEQGEYDNDWGLLFELEREIDEDIWEIGSSLIVLHEWNKWVGTANLSVVYETASNIKSEIETELATQLKYRYSQKFEPAIEFFKSENTNAIGPSATGLMRLSGNNKIRWEAGAAFSFDRAKADTVIRLFIEYEFY